MQLVDLLKKYDYDCTEEIENYLQQSPLDKSYNWVDNNSVNVLSTKEIRNRIKQNYYYDNEDFIVKKDDIVFNFNYEYLSKKYNVPFDEMCVHISRIFLNLCDWWWEEKDTLLLVISDEKLFSLHLPDKGGTVKGLLLYSSNEEAECFNTDCDIQCYNKLLSIIN
jgi:hypothetical protein